MYVDGGEGGTADGYKTVALSHLCGRKQREVLQNRRLIKLPTRTHWKTLVKLRKAAKSEGSLIRSSSWWEQRNHDVIMTDSTWSILGPINSSNCHKQGSFPKKGLTLIRKFGDQSIRTGTVVEMKRNLLDESARNHQKRQILENTNPCFSLV